VKPQSLDECARLVPDEGAGSEPLTQGALSMRAGQNRAEPATAVRSRKGNTSRPRWPPAYPGSAEALCLLTLRPVFATPVPRHHVAPRAPDGKLVVDDRATGEQFVVYSPRFIFQFRAGHHAGRWYLRPADDVGTAPQSVGFPAPHAALEALRAGGWRLPHSRGDRKRNCSPCRVIWSCSSEPARGDEQDSRSVKRQI
jgi:hypothetical protein